MSVTESARVWLLDFFLLQYSVVYALSPYLCFIFFLYLDLYFQMDDASMGWGSLVQTKHLFVLIHFRIKSEVGTDKHVWVLQFFLLTIPRQCFFCGSFLLFVSHVSYAVLSVPCSLMVTCWTSWLSLRGIFFLFCHFPVWFPGSGVASIPDFRFFPYFVRSTTYLYAIMTLTGDFTQECHRDIKDRLVYILFAKSRIYSNIKSYSTYTSNIN